MEQVIRIKMQQKEIEVVLPDNVLTQSTVKSLFILPPDAVVALWYEVNGRRRGCNCETNPEPCFLLPEGWPTMQFFAESSHLPLQQTISVGLARDEPPVDAKRKRVEDIFTEEEKVSYWDSYKHFLYYTKLDEKSKAAASLFDKHHLVLCLHEIPQLQEVRVELIRLSNELDEFLQEYSGDENFKDHYSSNLQEQISAKEKELKFKASKIVMEFFNYKNESSLLKLEYYNWQHDVCVMRSLKPLHDSMIETECCDRGTNYIMLGFRPPEYSCCVIDGIISGFMNGHYYCGSPGTFPGMSGGPVLEKFPSGRGRLLGICSGSQDSRIGINSSFSGALNVISDAQTNLPYVLISPAFQFRFGLPKQKNTSLQLIRNIKEMHFSSNAIAITRDNEDKFTQTDN